MKIIINEGFPDIEIIINCPRASDEIQKIESILRSFDKKIFGIRDGKTYMIDKQNIFYFETVDKQCFIYTADDVYETPLKLYEIEDFLTDMGFLRCTKSQIVNIAKIVSLCPEFGGRMEVVVENGEKLIVSRQYARLLKERLGLK